MDDADVERRTGVEFAMRSAAWRYYEIFDATCTFAILRIDRHRVPKTRVALYREEDGSVVPMSLAS